jgi:hypothetical protein
MDENLLHQIQNEAVDSCSELGNILRKCRLLAQRIGSDDLKSWVSSELNGYDTSKEAPGYRTLRRPLVLGHYFGVMGSQLTNVVLPESSFPEEFRDLLIPIHFHQGVSELRSLINNHKEGNLFVALDSTIYPVIKMEGLRDDFQLAQAKKVVPVSFIEGILDTIRNRVLNFTLELEEFAPMAGASLKKPDHGQMREIQQTFNTHIMGSVSNLNQGGNHVSQNVRIAAGDLESVARELAKVGLSVEEVNDFTDALKAETPGTDGIFGNRVSALLGKAIQKAGTGALKIPASVAGSLISELIKNYYGM